MGYYMALYHNAVPNSINNPPDIQFKFMKIKLKDIMKLRAGTLSKIEYPLTCDTPTMVESNARNDLYYVKLLRIIPVNIYESYKYPSTLWNLSLN